MAIPTISVNSGQNSLESDPGKAGKTGIATDDSIIAELSQHIAGSVGIWYGSSAQLISQVPEVRRYRLSTMLAYKVQTGKNSIVTILAKIATRPDATTLDKAIFVERLRQLSQKEFVILNQVAGLITSASDKPKLTAVHPIAYLEQWNTIVVEELPSISAAHILVNPRFMLARSTDTKLLKHILYQAGTWLYLFHSMLGSSIEQRFEPQLLIAEIEGLLSKLQTIVQRQDGFDRLYRHFVRAAIACDQRPILVARSHGDFHLGNVLLDVNQRIAVIDVGGSTTDVIAVDIANMITELTIRRNQVVSYGLFIRQKKVREFQQAFLVGYFGKADVKNLAIIELYCVRFVLQKWLNHEMEFSKKSKWKYRINSVFQAIMRIYFYKLCFKYIKHTFSSSDS
jgi:thiamine kinase-like enzyme